MRQKLTVISFVISLFSLAVAFVVPTESYAANINFSFVIPSFTIPTPPPIPTFPRSSQTPQPSATPSPSVTPKPTVTQAPTSTPTPKPTVTPQPSSTPSTSSVKDYQMNAINNYRKSQGLSAVLTDSYTCSFAKIRAKEISTGFNHNGFSNRVNNHTLPYPSYHEITENIAMTSNYQQVVNLWINSAGHAANMRANTPYVCVEQYGNYYAYEGWRP